MGSFRFGAPRELISWIHDTFTVHCFIETGTNKAETTSWAAGVFAKVYTIEGYEPLHADAAARHANLTNVSFLLGNSRDLLPKVLSEVREPAVVWLDAHWCGEHTFGSDDECPVLSEIDAINASSREHFILVDDARLFVKPPRAPHQAAHWPDIASLCRSLSTLQHERYVFIHEDVLAAVPLSAKDRFIEYLRSPNAADADIAPTEDTSTARHRSLGTRAAARIRRLLGQFTTGRNG